MKVCPRCNLGNPASAQRCDCGYDFEAGALRESLLSQEDQARYLRNDVDIPTMLAKAIVFIIALVPFIFLGSMLKEDYQRRATIFLALVVAWAAAHRYGPILGRLRITMKKTDNEGR